MIKFATINILGQPNFILDLKKKIDKTLKNIQTVSIVSRNGKVWKHGPNWPFFLYNFSSENY